MDDALSTVISANYCPCLPALLLSPIYIIAPVHQNYCPCSPYTTAPVHPQATTDWSSNRPRSITDEEKCQTVDGIETESVFYSLPDNPCCEYHGCVVRDCEDLRKQWKYDGNKTCTEDDTPNGAEAVCKERVEVSVRLDPFSELRPFAVCRMRSLNC